jgi:hypothetical protein
MTKNLQSTFDVRIWSFLFAAPPDFGKDQVQFLGFNPELPRLQL